MIMNKKFIMISAHQIILKYNYLKKPVSFYSTNIKNIKQSESELVFLLFPDKKYHVKIRKKIPVKIKEKLQKFCIENKVNGEFS